MAKRRKRHLHWLCDVDGSGGEARRVGGRVCALDEVEVDGIRGREVLGRGLDDGEALGRVGRRGGVEAEERAAGEEGGEGGVGVEHGVDFVVEAAPFDAWGVTAAGDVGG